MSNAARSQRVLLSQIRSGFGTQPRLALGSLKATASVLKPETEHIDSPVVQAAISTDEQLQILETVMADVLATKPVTQTVAEATVDVPSPTSSSPAQTSSEDGMVAQNSAEPEKLVASQNLVAPQVSSSPVVTNPSVVPPAASPDPVVTPQVAPLLPQLLVDQAQQMQDSLPTASSALKEIVPRVNAAEVPPVPVALASEQINQSVLGQEQQSISELPAASTTTEALTANPTETAVSNQYQEIGPVSPEISPEISSYLQEVASNHDQLPQEIVVANNDIQLQPAHQQLRPVIVLPVTPEIEKVGAKQKPTASIRWLVEWSRRLMKMFAGQVIYRES